MENACCGNSNSSGDPISARLSEGETIFELEEDERKKLEKLFRLDLSIFVGAHLPQID